MLYHFQVFVPDSVKSQVVPLFGLKYSAHAKNEAANDRYGEIADLPKHFLPRKDLVVEYETDSTGKLIKIVARQFYNDEFDVVMAINTVDKIVKTLWLNSRTDKHSTLDRSKYNTK